MPPLIHRQQQQPASSAIPVCHFICVYVCVSFSSSQRISHIFTFHLSLLADASTATASTSITAAVPAYMPPPTATPRIPRMPVVNPYVQSTGTTTATPSIRRSGQSSSLVASITPGPNTPRPPPPAGITTPRPPLLTAAAPPSTDPSIAMMLGLQRILQNGNPLPPPPRQTEEDKIRPFLPKKISASSVATLVSRLNDPPSIKCYLRDHGRKDVDDTSANLRAILQVNSEQKDEDEFLSNG